MLLTLCGISIELENASEIARHKALGYEEVKVEKPKPEKAAKPKAGK